MKKEDNMSELNNIKKMIKERDVSREELQKLGNFSRSTYFKILKGERKLSQLEMRGLESLPKKRGRKPKNIE